MREKKALRRDPGGRRGEHDHVPLKCGRWNTVRIDSRDKATSFTYDAAGAAQSDWNAIARGGGNGASGCSRDVWFTRAQARAFAACGGGGRKRPRY
jgi:hypothetical protein